ncbi:MAG: AMP-binding protein [Azospirillaceae bacterium]
MRIAALADIEALEARGFEAAYPHLSPYSMLRAAADRTPHTTAIRFLTDAADPSRDEIVSYADLLGRVQAAAGLFRSLGALPGRSVALLAGNTVAGQVALWGAQLAAQACPINPLLKADSVAALIGASDAVVVVLAGRSREVDAWSTLLPGLRAAGVDLPVLDCDADDPCAGSDGRFEDLVAKAAEQGRHIEDEEGTADDTAALYHTGGTTGTPKLVRHSRLNEAHVARSCALMHDLQPDDVVINGFPIFHVAGAFVYGLSTLSVGATQLIPGRLGMRNRAFMDAFWRQVERHRASILAAVPTILSGLLSRPLDADIASLRYALTGGSPLPPELAEAFEHRTGVPVRNIFGMTETAGGIAVEPVHGPRTPQSCGLRFPFSEVRIAEPADAIDPERTVSTGETGIILVRGPNVSSGYTDPSLGGDTFLADGWLATGDLGRIDAAGRLFITGRQKDVIIRGSHNIDPQGIEDVATGHPDVEMAAAIGMPDAYAGELPVLFVTRRQGAAADEAALHDFLRARIGEPAAMPKRIAVLDQLPLTPVGKIFKPALRRIAVEWAVRAAAERVGVAANTLDLSIDDGLAVTVTVPADRKAALLGALTGMPIRFTVNPRSGR